MRNEVSFDQSDYALFSPSPDSVIGSGVSAGFPYQKLVRGAAFVVFSFTTACGGGGAVERIVNRKLVSETNKPVLQESLRPEPTQKLDLPPMSKIADAIDYIKEYGECPEPKTLDPRIQIANPNIIGGVCPTRADK